MKKMLKIVSLGLLMLSQPFAGSDVKAAQRQQLEQVAQEVMKSSVGKSASEMSKMFGDGALKELLAKSTARVAVYEGSSIVASNDPALVGSMASKFLAKSGASVLEEATKRLASPEAKNGMVSFRLEVAYDSKPRDIVAFWSEGKKFVVTIAAVAAE